MSFHSLFGSDAACPSPKVVILLGAPGAGKGTQAVFLREKYGLAHISTGDLFRENLKLNTPIAQKAKSYIDRGELVPDEVVLDMLFNRLEKEDCKLGYILDGFPRTIAQAEALDKKLKDKSQIIVINLEVPDSLLIERLVYRRSCEKCGTPYHLKSIPPKTPDICDKCGGKLIQRPDDREEVIKERLETFHKQTKPLIAHYEKQGILKNIDGSISKEKTQGEVEKAVSPLFAPKS